MSNVKITHRDTSKKNKKAYPKGKGNCKRRTCWRKLYDGAKRLQGAFVTDEEVERIVNYYKNGGNK